MSRTKPKRNLLKKIQLPEILFLCILLVGGTGIYTIMQQRSELRDYTNECEKTHCQAYDVVSIQAMDDTTVTYHMKSANDESAITIQKDKLGNEPTHYVNKRVYVFEENNTLHIENIINYTENNQLRITPIKH